MAVLRPDGDPDDDYLLALLMRLNELGGGPIDGPVQFVLPQSAVIYRALDSGVPPGFEAELERAEQHLSSDVGRLPMGELMREIELKRAGIRERLLEAQRRQLALLCEQGGLRRDELTPLLEMYREEMRR